MYGDEQSRLEESKQCLLDTLKAEIMVSGSGQGLDSGIDVLSDLVEKSITSPP